MSFQTEWETGYTGADSTNLSGHSPDITNLGAYTMTLKFGAYIITSNKAVTATSGSRLLVSTGHADGMLSGQLTHGSNTTRVPRLIFRDNGGTGDDANAATSHWQAQISNALGGVELVENSAGVKTQRAFASTTIALNTAYNVQVEFIGSDIRIWVDSNLLITYSNSLFASNTWHGISVLGSSSSLGGKHDNTKFESVTADGQPLVKRFGGVPFAARIPNVW